MLVVPLGLGTRLRRWPVVTLAVGMLWILVFMVDRSQDRIMTEAFRASARSGIRDAARELFTQYCQSRNGDPARCRELSVLIWTGFPPANSVMPGPGAERTRAGEAAASAKVWTGTAAEIKQAKKLRKDLGKCGQSRSCYTYKNAVWWFLDQHRTHPQTFAALRGYRAYLRAQNAYRLEMTRICRKHECLVPGHITPASLTAAQLRHGDHMHLFGNLIAFVIFGIYAEQRTRRWLYLAMTLIGGTIGMAVHTRFFSSGDAMVLGGSANVSAAMGMFLVFYLRHRMNVRVWLPRKLYLGTTLRADVRYLFPLLYVLGDISGQIDTGFKSLSADNVAHMAHLAGFGFGALAAYAICLWRRVPHPFLYEEELQDFLHLESTRDLDSLLVDANRMLARNPDNVHVMEAGCIRALRWLKQHDSKAEPMTYEAARAFLHAWLTPVIAINLRKGQGEYALRVLAAVPLPLPFGSYLERLGQVNVLRLGDAALRAGDALLAIRLYDHFVTRFPLAQQVPAVEETVARVLEEMPVSHNLVEGIAALVAARQNGLLVPRLAAWSANARARAQERPA